jgi:hypothetical protein
MANAGFAMSVIVLLMNAPIMNMIYGVMRRQHNA